MNRDELLDWMAWGGVNEWPKRFSPIPPPKLPDGCCWEPGVMTGRWLAWPARDADGRGRAISWEDWRSEVDALNGHEATYCATSRSGSGLPLKIERDSAHADNALIRHEDEHQALTFGAQKYAAHSWRHVEDNTNRYWAAKSRHELARAKGETHDPEAGMLHLAHEATNALFLLELELLEREGEQ